MTRSVQGTATNEESAQTSGQRNAFSGDPNSNKGASRTEKSQIFNISERGTGEVIMTRAKEAFNVLYGAETEILDQNNHGTSNSENPDFQSFTPSNYVYLQGQSKFDDVSGQADLPNVFGPNLIAPDINNLENPTVENASSPFANKVGINYNQDQPEANGFGTETEYNDPRKASQIAEPYFNKRYNADGTPKRSTLGEFFDTETYNY